MSKATEFDGHSSVCGWLGTAPRFRARQALDVLTAIYLEITDDSRIGDQTTHDSSTAEGTRPDPRDLPRKE